jgi:tetratricopeptide (TPR) repeat protein
MQKDYGTSEHLLKEVLHLQPGSLAAVQSCVLLAIDQGEFAEALRWQREALKLNPFPNLADMDHLAWLLARAGNDGEAEGLYAGAIQRDSYDFSAHRGLGLIYAREKRWDEARKQLEVVIRYAPDAGADVYLDLARVYAVTGHMRNAEDVLAKGARIFPDQASTFTLANSL